MIMETMAGTTAAPLANSPSAAAPPATSAAYPWLSCYPAGVDWAQPMVGQPIPSLLDGAVKSFGDKPCTHFLGKRLTYSEIGALVDRATAGLKRIGVTKGMKVGLFLPNCPTFIVYYFAILKAGGVVVNYNPLYSLEELTFQIKDSETRVMVTLDLAALFGKIEKLVEAGTLEHVVVASFPALLPSAKSVLFRLLKSKDLAHPSKSGISDKITMESVLTDNDGRFDAVPIDPNDIAVLQYTGGTTGTPKGAALSHSNLTINVQQVRAWTAGGLKPGQERIIGILPFFHVFAMTGVMNLSIAMASEIVMLPRFVLDDTLKLIQTTRPTMMPGVPTVFNAMLNHPKIKTFDLSSLKFCLSGGAPLPLEVKRGFESLTGCRLVEAYGLSETSPGATFNPFEGPVKEGSIGQPIPGTVIAIRAPEDGTDVPLGKEGEICIKGPQVMIGYWNKPEETANVFRDGFFRTGDIGKMDDQGFTFITDRIKDMIICSGFKVFPRHVEDKIYEHPAVEEVSVIGIQDAYRGEAPKAFIKLKAGQSATAADILKHLEPKLSKIEMPSQIEFRDALPKTMIGKLSKKELKQEEAEKSRI
jgi:long-chain acyl-CoA synthetase